MVSDVLSDDVLSDAVQEIESIQQQMPGIYDAWAGEIDRVKESMVRLRIKLDTPHEQTPEKWIEGMIERFSQEPKFHHQHN